VSATARPCVKPCVNLIANRVGPDNPNRAISRLSCIGSLSSGSVESGPSTRLVKRSVFRQRAPGCRADQLELRRLPEQAIDARVIAGIRGQGDQGAVNVKQQVATFACQLVDRFQLFSQGGLRPLGDGLDEQSNPMGDSPAYALAKRRKKTW
jgi:hypothetical protein